MSDSCGYIALSHPPSPPRILIAFRGTYSITNTIIDLSTIPQEYTPYPDEGGSEPPVALQGQSHFVNLFSARHTLLTLAQIHHIVMIAWYMLGFISHG